MIFLIILMGVLIIKKKLFVFSLAGMYIFFRKELNISDMGSPVYFERIWS